MNCQKVLNECSVEGEEGWEGVPTIPGRHLAYSGILLLTSVTDHGTMHRTTQPPLCYRAQNGSEAKVEKPGVRGKRD